MQRQSDLTVAMKQACEPEKTDTQHCLDVMDATNPHCAALAKANAAGAPEGATGPDMKPCTEATVASPDCQSMMADLNEDRPECREAKQDLKDFLKEKDQAVMDQAFAPAPPPPTSPPAFTHCSSYDGTMNCITR
jgi:hypothetical protein